VGRRIIVAASTKPGMVTVPKEKDKFNLEHEFDVECKMEVECECEIGTKYQMECDIE
jgi:hypothetical protein